MGKTDTIELVLSNTKSIQKTVDTILSDREFDYKDITAKWEAVIKAIGELNTNITLLLNEVTNLKNETRRDSKNAVNELQETKDSLIKEIAPKKIVIIKRVEIGLIKWFKSFFSREVSTIK